MEIKNTDRELWRLDPDDYYSPSIHVTESGGIGIDVGGTVIVRPAEEWHASFTENYLLKQRITSLEQEIAILLDQIPIRSAPDEEL